VSDPFEEIRWLVLADWLEENDDPRRGELLRLHRRLLATCCEPEEHLQRVRQHWLARLLFRRREQQSHRARWHARIVELIGKGVHPCVPQEIVLFPDAVPMTFSFIPPGQFLMGSNDESLVDGPVHKVTLTRGFFMGIYPVTQRQWMAVMGTDPSQFKGPNRPVESVTWNDAQEFCRRLTASLNGHKTVRLPTDAEWEYACRAGTSTPYHFGETINTSVVNYCGTYSWNGSPKGLFRQETIDVDSMPCNPWGLFDVHGNVSEWCEDWYDAHSYPAEDKIDPCRNELISGFGYVMRMGSWRFGPKDCQASSRCTLEGDRNALNPDCGFRVCFHSE